MRVVCPKCSNEDKNYFFILNGSVFCRKCISFVGNVVSKDYEVKKGEYKIDYELTEKQKEASNFVLKNIIEKRDCAINAVCGAGKTEIIYESLKYCLNNNLKVGIAIPRKDVVIELAERLKKDFSVSVKAIYGGNSEEIVGDIIVFTTHQAYRYIDYFDVLIIDEIDAFPYNNNDVLKSIINKCSKTFVYLSATMPRYIEKNKNINKFYLNRRYHGYDLPIAKCKETFNMIWCLKRMLKKYKDKVVIVYFPTIRMQNKITKKVKCDVLINSKTADRDKIVSKIKGMDKGVVFTTTVLERGITIKDVQVIVYNSEHKLFSKDVLIQISGRVGRSKFYPYGDVIFICKRKNKEIKNCIKTLRKCNE